MKIQAGLRLLGRDQRGLSTVEYVVLLVLILAGGISLWKHLGGAVKEKLGQSNAQFDTVTIP